MWSIFGYMCGCCRLEEAIGNCVDVELLQSAYTYTLYLASSTRDHKLYVNGRGYDRPQS